MRRSQLVFVILFEYLVVSLGVVVRIKGYRHQVLRGLVVVLEDVLGRIDHHRQVVFLGASLVGRHNLVFENRLFLLLTGRNYVGWLLLLFPGGLLANFQINLGDGDGRSRETEVLGNVHLGGALQATTGSQIGIECNGLGIQGVVLQFIFGIRDHCRLWSSPVVTTSRRHGRCADRNGSEALPDLAAEQKQTKNQRQTGAAKPHQP